MVKNDVHATLVNSLNHILPFLDSAVVSIEEG